MTNFTGGNNILDWMETGTERNRYIADLKLDPTDAMTLLPVYYVSIKAENGAGLISEIITSTPVMVLDEDVTGTYIYMYNTNCLPY